MSHSYSRQFRISRGFWFRMEMTRLPSPWSRENRCRISGMVQPDPRSHG